MGLEVCDIYQVAGSLKHRVVRSCVVDGGGCSSSGFGPQRQIRWFLSMKGALKLNIDAECHPDKQDLGMGAVTT